MMIGDLALSGSESSDLSPTQIPTRKIGSEPFPIGSGYVITSLAQKVVQLTPNFILGWAGSEIRSRYFARQLREFLMISSREISEIRDFLQQSDLTELENEVQLLGLYFDGRSFELMGGGASEFQELQTRLPGSYIGTGGHFLQADIERLKNRGYQLPSLSPVAPANSHLAKCCGLVAGLIRKEITESTGFHHYYGGGYELCGFNPSGVFEKLDGTTFLFWDVIIDSIVSEKFNVSIVPIHMTRYLYVGDVLTIKSLHFNEISRTTLKFEEARIFHVHPLLSDVRAELIDDFDLMSFSVFSHISIFVKGVPQSLGAVSAHDVGTPDNPFLKLRQPSQIAIDYEMNMPRLHRLVKEFVGSMPPYLRDYIAGVGAS